MSWQPNKRRCKTWETCANYKHYNACIGGSNAKDIKESKHTCNAAIWVEQNEKEKE